MMATSLEVFSIALQHHRAGRLQEAEALYREILQIRPEHPEALHLLGLIAHQVGRHAEAVDLIGKAIALSPTVAAFHNNIGEAYRAQGKREEAVGCYRRAIELKPDYADPHHNLGVVSQEQGMLEEAIGHFRRALAHNPSYAEALNGLGVALANQDKLEEAISFLRQAVAHKPDYAEAYNNLGAVLSERGELEEAVTQYRRAIALKPAYAEAYNNLGNALNGQGKLEEAIASLRQAVAHKPDYAEAYYNLGGCLSGKGMLVEAEAQYRQALALKPDDANAYCKLGDVLKGQGKLVEAVAQYRQALAMCSGYAEAHNNLGVVLAEQGKWEEAEACYRQALTLRPAYAEIHNNLANVLREQGKLAEAVAEYRQALALKPDFAEAHNNVGLVLQAQGRVEEAVARYERALALKPDYAEAHYNLGLVFQKLERMDEVVTRFERALALKPGFAEAENQLIHHLEHLCVWAPLEKLFERQRQRIRTAPSTVIAPFVFLSTPSSPVEQLICARNFANRLTSFARLREGLGFHFLRCSKSRLRIGYLSADFRQHPVAWLIPELFELHDRSSIEAFAYSYGPDDGSAIRKRLARACDQFVDIMSASFVDAARRIHEDGVDILVDLTGHTNLARTQIAALRPAPIQVNWLGYPGTMGTEFIDYIIADAFIIPPDHEAFYSEKVVRLPDCYQVNDRTRAIAEPAPTRTECGLPQDGFVFCCFNNTYKITPAVFNIWMRLLKAIPGSVLWLLEANVEVAANLRREAKARGVSPERLVFAPRVSQDKHLVRCRMADLFLDTLPYNGHVTASDALWAGLPVLTCAGEMFASRVAGSLLTAIGLPELITYSLTDYEALALRLARNPAELSGLRERLKKNRLTTPLFDSERFTRHIERAYHLMWDIYLNGESPKRIKVPGLAHGNHF